MQILIWNTLPLFNWSIRKIYRKWAIYVKLVHCQRRDTIALCCTPHNQTGLRKEIGLVDNIFVFNYLTSRNLGRKREKLIAVFVYIKIAFPLG